MQGCLKSAIVALKAGNSAERGPLYVAFFNFSVGLERLLKLILALNHCAHNNGKMPSRKALKDFGHDVAELYRTSEKLLASYNIQLPAQCRLDAVDRRLLEFLAGFAISGRYFNLDALTGGGDSEDPLQEWGEILNAIYKADVPELKRISNEEQVDALAASTKDATVHLPATGLDGSEQSYEEFCQDHGKILLVMPEVIWRLVKILCPMKELTLVLRERLQRQMKGQSPDIPYMEEFLEFVTDDKSLVVDDNDEEGWPYFT